MPEQLDPERIAYLLTHLEQSLRGYRTILVNHQVKTKKHIARHRHYMPKYERDFLANTIKHGKIHIINYTQIINYLKMLRDEVQPG